MPRYGPFYPTDPLREALEAQLGIPREEHERRQLRTLLYRLGERVEDGMSAEQMATRLLMVAPRREDSSPQS